MLRRDHPPEQVTEVTRAPLALVEFIAEHPNPRSPTPLPHSSRPSPVTRSARTRRQPTRIVLGAEVGLLVDGGLATAAVVTYLHSLGAVIVLTSPLLGIVGLVTAGPVTLRPGPHQQCVGGRDRCISGLTGVA